jgi:hydroxylaminobenzene mutase
MWHGMFLFLLGLVTGMLEQRFTNMRMGVSAHLEGVMNGTFLVVLGAIWTEVRLSPPAKTAAFWTALYGPMPTGFSPLWARYSARPPLIQLRQWAITGNPGKRL